MVQNLYTTAFIQHGNGTGMVQQYNDGTGFVRGKDVASYCLIGQNFPTNLAIVDTDTACSIMCDNKMRKSEFRGPLDKNRK